MQEAATVLSGSAAFLALPASFVLFCKLYVFFLFLSRFFSSLLAPNEDVVVLRLSVQRRGIKVPVSFRL